MLAVSPKLTTTIDFATPLREYIKSNYGEEAVVRHHQIIQDVHEQRMRLAHVRSTPLSSSPALVGLILPVHACPQK